MNRLFHYYLRLRNRLHRLINNNHCRFIFFTRKIDFRFKNKYYIQISGLPMGCICGPTIANIFMYILIYLNRLLIINLRFYNQH
jgi:hypothetical protein